MKRFAFCVVLLFPCSAAFCQSTAIQPGSSHNPDNKSTIQWPVDLSKGQSAQIAAKPSFKNFDCYGLKPNLNQVNAAIDFDHFLSAQCTDLKSHVELFAFNENPFSRSPRVVEPHLYFGPIPTQWPDAKFEQIPTQWPNLKLLPIVGVSPSLVPARGSR